MNISTKLGLILSVDEESAINEFVHDDVEMPDELYQKLFDFFCENNEIPYGTAKARDGDPYEWIANRLNQLT